MRCTCLSEIVSEIGKIISYDKNVSCEKDAEYFFRGEPCNYLHQQDCYAILEPNFQSYLDRVGLVEEEREIYEDALCYNVTSFHEDRTMAERLARMQHYRLPTRFADLSVNALLSTFFGAGGEYDPTERWNTADGFVRIIKVAGHKMKSFTSDIIRAIAHLPLVDAKNIDPLREDGDGIGYLSWEIKNERAGFSTERECREIGAQLRKDLQHVWAFKPIINSKRIRSQGGVFLAFGCGRHKQSLQSTFSEFDYDNVNAPSYGIKQIGYVQIAAEAKKAVLEELRMYGMPAEAVYPDLENVCQSLFRSYKNRKEN